MRGRSKIFYKQIWRELYETFFQDYTEKVWGVPCKEIKPEWGAQRVKGLSITAVLLHALKKYSLPQIMGTRGDKSH